MRAARFLFWRTVRGALTVFTMLVLTFALYFAIERQPPAGFYFPSVAHGTSASNQQVDALRRLYFLDGSKITLFVHYVSHLVRGDIGHWRTMDTTGHVVEGPSVGRAVYPELRETLSILLGGAVFVVLLSLPLGAISGRRIGSWADRVISFLALVLVCTHPMMLGLILRSAGSSVSWLPTTGYCTFVKHPAPTGVVLPGGEHPCGGPVAWATHLILPWLTFALLFLALYTRMVRASVAETIHEDFVRTARAKGASETRLLARHVLPNASLRVLTMVGLEISTAIGVCIYIESAYGFNGLGIAAARELGGGNPALTLPLDLAIVLLITLIVVIGNLVVDLLYAFIDPRVGSQRGADRTKSLVGGVF
jgi:peptide/nickel transport system permease protein